MAEMIRRREVSATEAVQEHVHRISVLQPALNAFVHLDAEGALKRARDLDEQASRGRVSGPLHGIPVSVKSNVDISGWPCPAGSLLRRSEVPASTAPMVQRLIDAGAVPIGNTNTPEFLMAYETDNRLTGKTNNPWNANYSAGGSSGGEGAAIAAGLTAGGIGSDGGGSIRVPAHFCGICGLKPTPGRIPGTGHFPPGNSSFGWLGVCGPMARTAADLRLLFETMAGPDPSDALSVNPQAASPSRSTLKGMRVGLVDAPQFSKATQETEAAVKKAAQLLSDQGFIVEIFRLQTAERLVDLWWFFFGEVIGELLEKLVSGKESQLSPIFSEYLDAARRLAPITMEEFVVNCAARDLERGRVLKAMEHVPVLLAPVCIAPAFRHGEGSWRTDQGYRKTMQHSQWLNLTGMPAVTIPMGNSRDGLPIGVQLIGRPFEDELILEVAQLLEEARGPWAAPPLT